MSYSCMCFRLFIEAKELCCIDFSFSALFHKKNELSEESIYFGWKIFPCPVGFVALRYITQHSRITFFFLLVAYSVLQVC